MRNSNEQIWRSVLADPGASEAQWMQAAVSLGEMSEQSPPFWYKLAWRSPLLTAVLLSFVGSYACCVFVQLGFDWGYRAVGAVYGQPSPQAMNQGVIALLILPHVVFPLNLGLAFACFRRYFGSKRPWFFTMMAAMAAELWFWHCQCGNSDGWGPACVLSIVAALTVAVLSYSAGYRVLLHFYTYWSVRLGGFINMRRALPNCAIYLVPSLILGLVAMLDLNLDVPLPLEVTVYALPLFVIGYRLVKPSRSLILALLASAMILAPIVVTNLLNVSGTALGTLLDSASLGPQLSWRAALSASLIATVTAGATALGCICACVKDEVSRA